MQQLQVHDLSPEEWRMLEFLEGRDSVSSSQIENELLLGHRFVLDSLHVLHYNGLIYFTSLRLGEDETIISRITFRGLEILHLKKDQLFRSRQDWFWPNYSSARLSSFPRIVQVKQLLFVSFQLSTIASLLSLWGLWMHSSEAGYERLQWKFCPKYLSLSEIIQFENIFPETRVKMWISNSDPWI